MTLSDGKEQVVESPQIFIEVKSVLEASEDDQGLRDIKGVKKAPFGFPVVFVIMVFILLAVVFLLYYRRRRTTGHPEMER